MQILVIILTIIVFTKTLSYGIYELNVNNKLGGITVIVFSIISLIKLNELLTFVNLKFSYYYWDLVVNWEIFK